MYKTCNRDTNLTINVQLGPFFVTELDLKGTFLEPVDGGLVAFL